MDCMKKNQIKILNFNTYTYGGAALAAIEFNDALNQMGYQSKLLVCESNVTHENIFQVSMTGFLSYFKKYVRYKKRKLDRDKNSFFSKHGFSFKVPFGLNQEPYSAVQLLKQAGFIPDIIIYHWVKDFISIRNMKDMSDLTGARSVWMLMDNAPFTGGCHYPFDCQEYRTGCRNCPLFAKHSDWIHEVCLQKKKLLPENMYIAGTTGDCNRARYSSCFKPEQIHSFLFPVNPDKFAKGDQKKAREFFQIPTDKKVILIGASNFQEERKGLGFLISALTLLRSKYTNIATEAVLLIAGINVSEVFHYLGYQTIVAGRLPEEQLICAYQAANLFLNTSVEDSGPLMINQSIMCGTPVVTFELGVAYDLVISGKTGYRAKLRDVEELVEGIHDILSLSTEEAEKVSTQCCQLIERQTESIGIRGLIEKVLS